MVIGFTMVNVVPGAEYEVWQELVKISGVTRVVHVFGEFDYVVIIEVNELSELNHAVDNIRLIKGIATTHTFVEHKLTFMS
jgi:uncharacterized protein with GYD domain